jgi:hypothetical protein
MATAVRSRNKPRAAAWDGNEATLSAYSRSRGDHCIGGGVIEDADAVGAVVIGDRAALGN